MSRSKKTSGSVFKTRSKDRNKSPKPNSRKARRLAMKKERLSHLPKSWMQRYKFYLLHPKEFFKYWFSAEGRWMFLKILLGFFGVLFLTFVIFYISVSNEVRGMTSLIEQRIQSTTNKYLDRNGELVWEDTGSGDILKFVESDQISQYIKDATVAIEDKDFFNHGGVSLSGIARAIINNFTGGATQGGSTLTQQLMKLVFFADQSGERGLAGIPRKIKEAILAIEAERVYTKDEILTYYLNVAPYGGRRNGVQSAAETYFGKSAKELTIAESALLAAIPQSPTIYNPYNTEWNGSLIERQNIVLTYMGKQFPDKYSADQIAEAKLELTVDNLKDVIKPLDSLLVGAKAPHFVQMAKAAIEEELGVTLVGRGGLTIKTTLDLRVQSIIDENIDNLFASNTPASMGFDNAAATMIDSQTGQILGMRGSRDYNYPDFGAVNAATAFIQPGSSIKPQVYASLIDMQRDGKSYGAGTMINDKNADGVSVQQIYGAPLRNANGSMSGSATIRNGLSQSQNIPAVMAMYFNGGAEPTIGKIRELGNRSYCTDGVDATVGLAAAIGGCGVKQVEHTNAIATLARMGNYIPYSSVLEVKDFRGTLLYKHDEEAGIEQVLDPQSAFIINDILADANSRSAVFGYCSPGFCIPGVKTATKTGTSDLGGRQKDLWFTSYSPKASFTMWWGNHIPATLRWGDGMSLGSVTANIVGRAHRDVFAVDGTWKEGDWFTRPAGIRTLNVDGRADIYPSWYISDNIQVTTEQLVFDRLPSTVSGVTARRLATECTPEGAREVIEVTKTVNVTRNETTWQLPDGFLREDSPNHRCSDTPPSVNLYINASGPDTNGDFEVRADVLPGSNSLGRNSIRSVIFQISGVSHTAAPNGVPNTWSITIPSPASTPGGGVTVVVIATDELFYVGRDSQNVIF